MSKETKRILDLQLFDEGAPGPTAEPGGVATPKADGKEKVLYGKNTAAAQEPETQPGVATGDGKQVDKESLFKEMIKGEYKDPYQKVLKEQMDRRFKNAPKEDPAIKSIIDSLKVVYEAEDTASILNAIEQDNRLLQEKADKEGMTVEQYRKFLKTERENAQLKEAERLRQEALTEQEKDARAAEIYQEWEKQGEELRNEFPNFDLEAECANPAFVSLLGTGTVDVGTAYRAVHLNEIMGGAIQTVANQVRKNTIESVRARGIRPTENGITEQPGTVRKDDVSKLTKQDRAKVAELALQGVNITFG